MRIRPTMPVNARVHAVRLQADQGDPTATACSILVSGYGPDGVTGTASRPLDVGEPVAMFFPPWGNQPGFDQYGYVAACRVDSAGVNVTIRFTIDRPAQPPDVGPC